jgi:hypothetical protein
LFAERALVKRIYSLTACHCGGVRWRRLYPFQVITESRCRGKLFEALGKV